ncbi:bacteriohemerythrin [Antarcticimicrobium sediminis]|uniref:Hemerythrin-like domain-containing protein n=1 Tax=Antarcticimicrobium sediminis TaxID=2546227 RepID=A0A4R5EP40_9RHOB|nr:hemerythrin domain-containing protein [Antarcticimicrobium sediminis]TDE36253.1 hypothetical protein E1B25_15170 [Antarcticimicrobium sediminis]
MTRQPSAVFISLFKITDHKAKGPHSMKWQPQFATGDAQIDEQHKMLFATSEQFRQTLEAGEGEKTYDLFLDFLNAYCEMHFSVEEDCMFAYKCPVAKENKHEHGLFLKLLDKENTHYHDHGFDAARAMAMLDKLDNWLASHICRIDVRLKESV